MFLNKRRNKKTYYIQIRFKRKGKPWKNLHDFYRLNKFVEYLNGPAQGRKQSFDTVLWKLGKKVPVTGIVTLKMGVDGTAKTSVFTENNGLRINGPGTRVNNIDSGRTNLRCTLQ